MFFFALQVHSSFFRRKSSSLLAVPFSLFCLLSTLYPERRGSIRWATSVLGVSDGDTGRAVRRQHDRCAFSRRPDQALPAAGFQHRGERLESFRPLGQGESYEQSLTPGSNKCFLAWPYLTVVEHAVVSRLYLCLRMYTRTEEPSAAAFTLCLL